MGVYSNHTQGYIIHRITLHTRFSFAFICIRAKVSILRNELSMPKLFSNFARETFRQWIWMQLNNKLSYFAKL